MAGSTVPSTCWRDPGRADHRCDGCADGAAGPARLRSASTGQTRHRTFVGTAASSGYIVLTPGQSTRLVQTGTPPVGAAFCVVMVGVYTQGFATNAIVGERVWYDNVYAGTDTSGAYYDGDTPAKGDYSYRWTGTPNMSASERYVQTYVSGPPPTAEDCYDRIGRSLHNVTTTTGPTVTQKMTMTDGGTAWSVTWTMVAANPAEFGVERPLVQGFLDPDVAVPYVGGVIPPGGAFDEDGSAQTDADCAVTVFRPVYDPLCSLLVPPPDVPSVVPTCFSFPASYRRTSFVIPRERHSAVDRGGADHLGDHEAQRGPDGAGPVLRRQFDTGNPAVRSVQLLRRPGVLLRAAVVDGGAELRRPAGLHRHAGLGSAPGRHAGVRLERQPVRVARVLLRVRLHGDRGHVAAAAGRTGH